MHSEFLVYSDGKTSMRGLYVRPDSDQKLPLVIVAHAAYGCTDFEQGKARELAELGYAAFASDVFGEGVQVQSREEGMQYIATLLGDRLQLRSRIQAAVDTVRELPDINAEKIAGFGFCFGGITLLELLRSGTELNGMVGFHSLLRPSEKPLPGKPIRTPLLMLHGDLDPLVPPEQVAAFQQEMRESGADWEMVSYGQAAHSFTMPHANLTEQGMYYHERTNRRAWRSAIQFLEEVM